MDKRKLEQGINQIIAMYENSVKGINRVAEEDMKRAYGGVVRSGKGKLVEEMAQKMVLLAWEAVLNQSINRLKMDRKKVKVPINVEYIRNIDNESLRKAIEAEKENFYYNMGTDVHVYVDGRFVLAIECKAYTENAMLKRILVDATLLKKFAGVQKYVLLQLESQLGGDYSELKEVTIGSPSTRTLMSYFDIDLEIITMLKGERLVDKPIHNPLYYKELTYQSVERAVITFSKILKNFIN
jgi:hypothetical protein